METGEAFNQAKEVLKSKHGPSSSQVITEKEAKGYGCYLKLSGRGVLNRYKAERQIWQLNLILKYILWQQAHGDWHLIR